MKRYQILTIILSIVCGIAFGGCHAYSVALHKANQPESDIVQMQTNTLSIKEQKCLNGANTKPQSKVIFADAELEQERIIYDEEIPIEIQKSAIKWGEEYNICPELIMAIAYQESRYIPTVISADGSCVGLCQINAKWHTERMERLGVEDLTDVDSNIAVACDYLAELFEDNEDVEIVLMQYNGDSRWKSGYINQYAKEIVERSAELERKHGK